MAPPLGNIGHIGIVGCSAEGAALCYRTICAQGALLLGSHAHPEVSMHTPSLAGYVRCLERGDWPGVAELMLTSANKLAAIGADFLICPDNTLHQALAYVEPHSPRPWLHIAKVVAEEAAQRGFRRIGITARAGWSTARSIPTSWRRADWPVCARAAPNARNATTSS